MEVPTGGPVHHAGGGNGRKAPELKLRIPEAIGGGVYANTMVVQHSPHEFVLDFAFVSAGNGQVVARVITGPTHMKQIVRALEENIQRYEATNGPILPPAANV